MQWRWLAALLLLLLACRDPSAPPPRPKPERVPERAALPDPKAFPLRARAQFDPRSCNPDAIEHVDAEYPAEAAEDRVEGWVLVSGLVDRDGFVRDPIVLAADPEGVFERSALRAFAQWRYCAPDQGDVAPEVRTVLVFKPRR